MCSPTPKRYKGKYKKVQPWRMAYTTTEQFSTHRPTEATSLVKSEPFSTPPSLLSNPALDL